MEIRQEGEWLMDDEQVRMLTAAWGTELDESGLEEITAYLNDVLEAIDRFHEIDLDGVSPQPVFRAAWK
jgi:Asp-tRNA(Asn)/Glu-tRNA(Gln) amidotransferase C subunit